MILPRALTIAGSDSGGGAGVQADLKTFSVCGVYGMSALASITAQNTREVRGIFDLPPEFVAMQIDAVAEDIGVDAAKTGMLSIASIIEAVADRIRAHRIEKLVVDPVMLSKSGAPLLQPEAVSALKTKLLPLAFIVTPNLPEASALTGREVSDFAGMKEAARAIHDFGPRHVVIKGGHLKSRPADLLLADGEFIEIVGERFETKDTHGTGCIYSAFLTAQLAKGVELADAFQEAKRFITASIRHGLRLGSGHGPANPLAWLSEERE